MEFIVTSYKDRRKSPYEAAEASLRSCFEHFVSSSGSARFGVETLLVYTSFPVACNGLWQSGGVAMCGG